MKTKLLVVGLLSAVTAFAEGVPVTFNAVLSMGKERRFGVATEGGTRSAWVRVGESFEGYTVTAFDETRQALTLEKDGTATSVVLAGGGVQTLDTQATLRDAAEVMSRMKFDQMLARMIEQQKAGLAGMAKQLLGDTDSAIPAEEFAALQSRIIDALWSEVRPEDLKNDLTRIYADVYSKEELRALTEFYSTSAGQAFIDKEPEMQQRMMQVMLPRMLKAVPRIQEMTQQFAAEQAAKGSGAGVPVPPK